MNCPSQRQAPSSLTVRQIASAVYEGSPEHKARRWWGGLPGVRPGADGKASRPKKQETTICPLVGEQDRVRATSWVQDALRSGNFKRVEGRKGYPKRLYYKDRQGGFWEGRVINRDQGNYKGWPVSEEQYNEIARKLG